MFRAGVGVLVTTLVGCAGDDGEAVADETSGSSSTDGPTSVTAVTIADSTGVEPDTTAASTETTPAESSGESSSTAASSESSSTGDTEGGVLDDAARARIADAVDATLGTGYATGCSIAIWRDGEVVYAEGFGTKNEAEEPVTADTLFQIGSDTKKMTAIALLQQVDAGTVDLETTVTDVLPTLDLAVSPGTFDTLTIDWLLSHRSGLFDYTPWDDAPDDGELSLRSTTAFAANEYAMMPPGVAWNYSNPNFSLAGLLTETLTGEAWADVLVDDVALPLGMTHTYARRDDMLAVETDIASGVGPILAGDLNTFDLLELFALVAGPADWTTPEDHADNAFTRPAGLAWSTASDMARLAGFLLEGNAAVLSDELRTRLQTGLVALAPGVDPTLAGYGYGVMAMQGFGSTQGYLDVPVLQHGGNTLDMTSTFILLPEQNVAVSILSNGSNDDMSLVAAVALEEAAADRLPEPSAAPSLVEPPADDLSVYAGSFVDHALGPMTLTWTGTELEIDVPLFTELGAPVDPVLEPAYRDVFLMSIGGGQIDLSFYPGLDGTPHRHAVNRSFVFGRTDGPIAMDAPRVLAGRSPIHADAMARRRPLSAPRWR